MGREAHPLGRTDGTRALDASGSWWCNNLGHRHPRLRRALANLLNNAAKFTTAGYIRVSARREGDGVRLAVADTGTGIAAADLPHIFDAFHQVARKGETALQGTGLGLAIARLSAELLGGGIAVDSREGEGTTFTLSLPDTMQGKSG